MSNTASRLSQVPWKILTSEFWLLSSLLQIPRRGFARASTVRDMILTFRDGFPMLDAVRMHFELPELGLTGLWKLAKRPGVERRRRRAVAEVLKMAREMIDVELGIDFSKSKRAHAVAATIGRKVPAATDPASRGAVADDRNFNIFDITELMLDSKKRSRKMPYMIRATVKTFSEWCGGRVDIRDFDKRDLIGFVKGCLPYIPKNAALRKRYIGVSLLEQTKLVKDVCKTDDNIRVIDVNRIGPNKRVKNDSSVRVVPIHPYVLNELGFMDYVVRQVQPRNHRT